MYSLPPAVLFNEQTGRLELQHAAIMRRVRRTQKLRSRYRSFLIKRLFRFVLALPRHGVTAGAALVASVIRGRATRAPLAARLR